AQGARRFLGLLGLAAGGVQRLRRRPGDYGDKGGHGETSGALAGGRAVRAGIGAAQRGVGLGTGAVRVRTLGRLGGLGAPGLLHGLGGAGGLLRLGGGPGIALFVVLLLARSQLLR